MSIFRKRSTPPPLVENRCWHDPALDALADVLDHAPRPADERVRAALDALAAARDDPERAVLTLDAAADRLARDGEAVGAAVAALDAAADPHDRADALALHAAVTTSAGWAVRGSGRADTVTEGAWGTFHAMLEQADELGWRALDLVPAHPGAATWRLVSGRGLGLPSDEWWQRFEVARTARDTLYPAHFHMLQALCDKWYGSHDLMLGFGRRVAQEAPAGDPVSAMLVLAHVELELAVQSAGTPAAVRDEARRADTALLRTVSDQWLAADAAVDRAAERAAGGHPRAVEAHQLFGWFFQGDKKRAAAHLSRVGGRMAGFPWRYFDDPRGAYRRVSDLAGVPV